MLKTFPYNPEGLQIGDGSLPFLRMRLRGPSGSTDVLALVDSGAAVGVLPYPIGESLGLQWDNQFPVTLTGNLGSESACGVIAEAEIEGFPPRSLAFAWSKRPTGLVILGQRNFFDTFDVHFHGRDHTFDIALRN